MLKNRNNSYVILSIITGLFAIIGLVNSLVRGHQTIISISSILFIFLIIISIFSAGYYKINNLWTNRILLISALLFSILLLCLCSSTYAFNTISYLAPTCALFTVGFTGYDKKRVSILNKMGATLLMIGWIAAVYINKRSILGTTSILYIILLLYALFGSEIYGFSKKNMSIILICIASIIFIFKRLIGVNIGIGLFGASLIMISGCLGLTIIKEYDIKNNYIYVSSIVNGLLYIIIPLATIFYIPINGKSLIYILLFTVVYSILFLLLFKFSEKNYKLSIILLIISIIFPLTISLFPQIQSIVGNIFFTVIYGVLFILLALYSKKHLKISVYLLIVLSVASIIMQLIFLKNYTLFSCVVLVLLPAIVTLVELNEEDKITKIKQDENRSKIEKQLEENKER